MSRDRIFAPDTEYVFFSAQLPILIINVLASTIGINEN